MVSDKNNGKFLIRKSHKISGSIAVKGAKNHALKVLAAVALSDKDIIISNVPQIEDIKRTIELLELIGVKVRQEKDNLVLNAKNIKTTVLDPEKSSTIRTSIVLAASLLARFGKVSFYHPGGCILGKRPVDLFLLGFQKLGAKLTLKDEFINVTAVGGRLKGGDFFFPPPPVSTIPAVQYAPLHFTIVVLPSAPLTKKEFVKVIPDPSLDSSCCS